MGSEDGGGGKPGRDAPETGGRLATDRAVPADRGPVAAEVVRAHLDRLLGSVTFRHSERLCRFLKFVVEQQLAGNADQIKESVLAVEIFDRATTYDSRVDSVVRVEARRLRAKLDKYYSHEGLEDPVIIALPKGSYAPAITFRGGAAPGTEAQSSPVAGRRPKRLPVLTVAVAVTACVLVTIVLMRWAESPGPNPPLSLRRLTEDSGLTFQAALSMDGKLVAYASDRNGRGDLDIWLQQVSGGLPVRLTDSVADDTDPAFSPDGTVVAYRTEGNVSGIYTVPALGGKSTLLVEGGYRPRFSPDGARVAYWTGARMYGKAKVFVVSSAGGNPVQMQSEFAYAAFPVWSPDGRHILFVGSKQPLLKEWDPSTKEWDWWVAPVDGGPAVRTSAQNVFAQHRLRPPETGWSHRRIIPYSWTPSGHLVFSASSGAQTNIWRVRISPRDWQVSGPAEQLTFGAGRQDHPSTAADGTLVFSALSQKSDIWSLPIDAGTAEPSGQLTRLTSGPANYMGPFVAPDGKRLAFISNRSGNGDVWVRDLQTGTETAITATRETKSAAVLSPDGSQVAFGYSIPLSVFVAPATGGRAVQLCKDCGQPRAWLPNGRGLLYQWISPSGESQIGLLELSGHAAPLVRSSKSVLFSPSVTQDGRWMALIVRTPPDDHRVKVIPLRGHSAAAEPDWITVTESGSWVDKPRWSPSANVLYYVSDRDGFVCLWARRLDAATKKPAEEPRAVVHFHNRRISLGNVYGLELSVAKDKLVFNLVEGSSNIWLATAGR